MNPLSVLWIFEFTGLVYIITQSSIAMPLRVVIARRSLFLRALLYCPACTGAWVSLGLAVAGHWPLFETVRELVDAQRELSGTLLALLSALVTGSSAGFIWGGAQRMLVGDGGTAWELEQSFYEEKIDAAEEGPSEGGS